MSSRLGKFAQTPNEVKRYTITYEDWLDDDETVVGVELLPSAVALEVIAFAISGNGKLVSYFIGGGDDGVTYELLVRVVTSAGQTKEDLVLYVVRGLSQ